MSRLRRASLGDDFGYTPGELPPDGGGWVKLNANESPLPPSPRVAEAVRNAAAELRRYPDPFAEPLRTTLAAYHGVQPEQVLVTNGADQVIDCCFRAFCEPGDRVAWAQPSYSLLPVLARVFACVAVPVSSGGDPLPAGLGTVAAALRFVVNPNPPYGAWAPPGAVEEVLGGAAGVVAIDEAYCDFAPASCIGLLRGHDSWLVLRSFSKSHSLAGLRVGYAVGDAALIADLAAVKDSYPVDRCAIAGAMAALEDEEHHRVIVETVVSERARLTAALRGAGWDVPESCANFVFARPPDGDAAGVQRRLRERRILVRHFGGADADRVRITVGTAEENGALLAALGA